MPKLKLLTLLSAFTMLSLVSKAQLNANFTASTTTGCPPLTVVFNSSSSTGSPTNYSWKFTSPSTVNMSTLPNPSFIYTIPGTYTVELTISNASGSDVETKTNYITVYPPPTVDFSAPTLRGCVPFTANFSFTGSAGGSGANIYTWYFGAAATPATATTTSSSASAVYTAGPNNVTLVVTNSYGCQAQKTKTAYIDVFQKPSANFTVDNRDFCASPGSVNFTGIASGGTGPYSYTWAWGDALPGGTGATASHTYTFPPNSYSPRLIVTDANGCKDTNTKNGFIAMHTPTASISSASSVCQGLPITFNSTISPSGGTYSWNFGNIPPGSSTLPNPSYIYNTSGTFTVTLDYTYRGCNVTATKSVTINPKPVADFTISPDTLCPAPAYVQFIPIGSFTNYQWSFGDPLSTTSTATSPIFQYLTNDYYTPTLMVTNSFGCKDTITKPSRVKVHDLFERIYVGKETDSFSGCVPLTVPFRDTAWTTTPNLIKRPYPYPIQTWDWDWGDLSTHGTTTHPTHTYIDTGRFRVILTITTTKNCITKDTFWVIVGLKPCANFIASPLRVCICKPVQFTNLTTCPVTTWQWDFGDGGNSNLPSPTHSYCNMPDTYTVRLIADHNGCKDTMIKKKYIIVDSSKSIIGFRPSCDTPLKIYFKNNSVGFTSHRWYFGDPANTQSTAMDPVFIYPAPGTYTVRLATANSRSGCTDTADVVINIVVPTINLTANDTTVCVGDTINFNAQLVGRSGVTYQWYVDNNLTLVTFYNPVARLPFNIQGYHSIKVIITDDFGCNTTIIKNNWILVSKPVAAFTAAPTIGCIPLTVNFTDNSTVTTGASIISRYWDYGNGIKTFVTGTSSSSLYPNVGTFTVKLLITDNIGCKDSITKVDYIQANKPHADFIVKDTACINEVLTFANNSSIGVVSSFWDFGDLTTSSSMNPTHAYSALGSYTVKLIVTDATGCKDTIVKIAAVNLTKPTAAFSMSDSVAVCPPLYVKFTNLSTNIVSSSWDLGNSNMSTTYNTNSLYTTPNNYKIVLKVTDRFGCVDSTTKNVNIYGYAGAFTYGPLEGCAPLTVNFTATVTNVSGMEWDFSDGTVIKQLGNAISHTYTTPGAYIPKLVVSDISGCKAISPGLDTIKVDAVITDFIPDAPCQYSLVTLKDTSKSFFSTVALWRWTFDDGSKSTVKNPTHFYGAPGRYPIKLYVENTRGCKDSITKDITIYSLPVISAGADTIICLKDSAQLLATGGVSYIWNTTPYLSCLDCANPLANPPTPFSFIVTGKDIHNCINYDTVMVKIKTKVTAISAPDGEICDFQTMQLSVTGAKSYVWTPADALDNPNSATPISSSHSTIKYRVVSFEGSCIPDTDFVKVTVHPLPDVTASGTATIIAGNSTNIQATGTLIDKFKWEPAESLSCSDCPDPTANPLKTTEYIIKVYTSFGCVDSDKVTITVLCDKSQIFTPNTFTPNGDGQNDVFYPRGVGLGNIKSFRIYNRWGEVVFERSNIMLNDKTQAWDGTFKGNVLPPDVFVYTIEAVCEGGQNLNLKGDITIVR